MASQPNTLTIRRPDDWHLHLRQGAMLKQVLPYTSRVFQRAIIMPNLAEPITSIKQAQAYQQEIRQACPAGDDFTPLLTCYLTDNLNQQELAQGFQQGYFTAAKLYPAHATTNSQYGVSNIKKLWPLFEKMQQWGMPLLLHGEVTQPDIDIFDREAYFIDRVLIPLRQDFPALKIVLEHITTEQAASYVLAGDDTIAATITPQHLLLNRNDMLVGGIRPHLYCLPILKRQQHQQALQAAIKMGCSRLFLGTDSAPHSQRSKESNCGCAGVFNAAHALAIYAQIFEQCDALSHFEAFCSINGPQFYQLPINQQTITLTKQTNTVPDRIGQGEHCLIPFLAGQTLTWQVDLPFPAH